MGSNFVCLSPSTQGQLQDTLERVRREADRREDVARERQEDVRRRYFTSSTLSETAFEFMVVIVT